MDIEYMKRFIAVSQCLNFSKAAEELFISQPTLSHSVTNLEKKVGAQLLVRNTKSVKLTPEGKRLLPAFMEIVRIYESAVQEVSQQMNSENGVLNIGQMGPAIDNRMSYWIRQFGKVYPNVEIQVLRCTSAAVKEAFENRQFHLCVMYKKTADTISGLKYQVVGQERFKVCLNEEHPLAKQERISLKQLKDERFLLSKRTAAPEYHDRVLQICAKRGLEPKISQYVSLVSNIYGLVGSGLGVAILSCSQARSYEAYHVKFVDIDDGEDLVNDIVVAWKGKIAPLARKFREIAQKESSRPEAEALPDEEH